MATLSLTLLNCASTVENPHTTVSSSFTTLSRRSRYSTCSFAKKSLRKSIRDGPEASGDILDNKFVQNDNLDTSLNPAAKNSDPFPSRSAVLQACIITSGLIAALGLVIRQLSHVASVEGLPILDCSTEVSFGFELWHLELITGTVVLISSCRYLLLKTWPNFAESSEAANKQVTASSHGSGIVLLANCNLNREYCVVDHSKLSKKVLSSLQPLDYIVVAFLPGISEELLFRGAILPLLGTNWNSIGIAALIFGILHLGNGRKYSFAIWATFVGLAYGYATILSSSVAVPMASHADTGSLYSNPPCRGFDVYARVVIGNSWSKKEKTEKISYVQGFQEFFVANDEQKGLSYEQEGRPLPKFGEWDVNDPASAEGFTVIFNKARDDKKTGAGSVRVQSQRRNNSRKEEDKSAKFSSEASSVSRPRIRDKRKRKDIVAVCSLL
ncbi:hypothetical protein V8G54_004121 [Vigna mungo]|uniref:RIN4 pathogenic type III effector avirulence factor Avr cleavage site domain-containing protein n=1 Tax=Vigna mungo TaxID=3915 RepID=A0AAQ3SCH5_VIGMU